MIRVGAHQPNFLPWPGFWHKLISSDVFVVCAGFQYRRRGYENRVIMRDNGRWATIPVSGGLVPSKQVKIADPKVPARLARRIKHWSEMRRYRYRHRLKPIIERLERNTDALLSPLNYDLIALTLETLGHHSTKLVLDMKTRAGMSIGEVITDIVTAHGDTYLCGPSSPNYVSRRDLTGIDKVFVQKLYPGMPSETVLHLIAEQENPVAALRAIGAWEPWD